MKQFSVPMALVDYIPVILFFLGAFTLIRDLRGKVNKTGLMIFRIGAYLVVIAGFLKATYKLLYALGIGDFLWMSEQFFTSQAFGFLLAGIGLMICQGGIKAKNYSFLPTMALVGIMVVGLGAMDAALCSIAHKLKERRALILFVISFFVCLCMGYLSSKDFTQSFMNWVAQGINIIGQLTFFLGTRLLHKAGLKD